MDIDALLITHCAPTLARLKIGSLLCFHNLEKAEDFQDTIEKYNRKYNSKGLYFRILFACPKRTLLYVYRPGPVRAYMTQRSVIRFLKQYGYTADMSLDDMLTLLEKRFDEACCFPHEAGLFLGYPVEDVYGFIHHKGSHAKLCGEWKVYGNPQKAARLFNTFTRCRKYYSNRYSVGIKLEELIIA